MMDSPSSAIQSQPTEAISPSPLITPRAPLTIPLPRLLPALATGGLLYLCHFPVAFGWLAWVALVPLLCLVRSPACSWRIYLAAWLGGLAFFIPALQWMRVADPMMYFTWAALALYCSLYLPAGVLLVRWLDRRTPLPLVLSLPVVWTALEFLRAHLLTGFAWYFLGHTQHDFLPVIQIADLTGVYGVTFVVAACNALVFELLFTATWFRRWFGLVGPRRPWLILQAVGVVLLLAGTLTYGCWRLGQNDFGRGPRLALVQGNLEQGVRNARNRDGDEGKSASETITEHYSRLSTAASRLEPPPELIVWPETSYPYDWEEIAPDVPPDQVPPLWRKKEEWSRELPAETAKAWRAPVLLGLNSRVYGADERVRRYNSALLIERHGFRLELLAATTGLPLAGFPANLAWAPLWVGAQKNAPTFPVGRVAGRYDKMHLVPFGEYVPLRESLPWMKSFSPYDFDYSVTPGQQMTRFPLLPNKRFGVLICYEDTDPLLARHYVRTRTDDPPPVDFLLNISNDGWFNGTCEHEEHLAICRFRAVECRRSVARAVNMGISAVIDPNGRVLAPTSVQSLGLQDARGNDIPAHLWEVTWSDRSPPALPVSRWHEMKKVQGVLTAEIPIAWWRPSYYANWGDWLPWACWVIIALGAVVGYFRPDRLAGLSR